MIWSEDVHPDHITELLGIQPTEIEIKGDPIDPTGYPGRFYEHHCWEYDFDAEIKDATLNSDFERLYNLFLPKAEIIRGLKLGDSGGVRLSIYLRIDTAEKGTGPGVFFEDHFINFLSQVNASVDIDLYAGSMNPEDQDKGEE